MPKRVGGRGGRERAVGCAGGAGWRDQLNYCQFQGIVVLRLRGVIALAPEVRVRGRGSLTFSTAHAP